VDKKAPKMGAFLYSKKVRAVINFSWFWEFTHLYDLQELILK